MIYAIGDLHLGFGMNETKSMHIFGEKWKDHHKKIKTNWNNKINIYDTVLVAGDISWAMSEEEFKPDVAFIHSLNGKKIIISGNHDYWWGSTNKLNTLYEDIFFIKNNFMRTTEGFHICGTRGWISPFEAAYTKHDDKIYQREISRLKTSLDQSMADGAEKIVVMLHYPPFFDNKPTGFVELVMQYPVETVVYGHLHGEINNKYRHEIIGGIHYRLVSADYIDFCPVRVIPVEI